MPPERGSPADWLGHAKSDLALAKSRGVPGVLLEMLCFHAQQAVEKSLKAVLTAKGVDAPRTHNLTVLASLLPSALKPPAEVLAAATLTDYAVVTRYPGEYEPVSEEEYREAVRMAESVVAWAERSLAD